MKLKKITAFILTISIILSLFPATVSATSNTFTTADALTVLRAAAGLTTLSAADTARFDMDGDGKITTADALMILRRVAGIDLYSQIIGVWEWSYVIEEVKRDAVTLQMGKEPFYTFLHTLPEFFSESLNLRNWNIIREHYSSNISDEYNEFSQIIRDYISEFKYTVEFKIGGTGVISLTEYGATRTQSFTYIVKGNIVEIKNENGKIERFEFDEGTKRLTDTEKRNWFIGGQPSTEFYMVLCVEADYGSIVGIWEVKYVIMPRRTITYEEFVDIVIGFNEYYFTLLDYAFLTDDWEEIGKLDYAFFTNNWEEIDKIYANDFEHYRQLTSSIGRSNNLLVPRGSEHESFRDLRDGKVITIEIQEVGNAVLNISYNYYIYRRRAILRTETETYYFNITHAGDKIAVEFAGGDVEMVGGAQIILAVNDFDIFYISDDRKQLTFRGTLGGGIIVYEKIA
jgi:hypothetical protein